MRVDRQTGGTVQGRVGHLLEASERRAPHRCPHEFVCTGCVFLAAPAAEEGKHKWQTITSVLDGIGGPTPDPLITPSPSFGYRHLAKQVFARVAGQVVLGSFVQGTHDVVDNVDCPVLVPPLQKLSNLITDEVRSRELPLHADGVDGLRYAVMRHSRAHAKHMLVLVTSQTSMTGLGDLAQAIIEKCDAVACVYAIENRTEGNVLLRGDARHLCGELHLAEEILGFSHRVGPTSFFQQNIVAAERLFGVALEMAGSGVSCVEAFCGVGALTLPLSRVFERVVALESNAEAVELLQDALRRHEIDNVVAKIGDAAALLDEVLRIGRPEVVVADPPRKGLGELFVGRLGASDARRLVLLSCDPQTLARDVPPLRAAGFAIERVVPIDQFPRTAHVETVTLLTR